MSLGSPACEERTLKREKAKKIIAREKVGDDWGDELSNCDQHHARRRDPFPLLFLYLLITLSLSLSLVFLSFFVYLFLLLLLLVLPLFGVSFVQLCFVFRSIGTEVYTLLGFGARMSSCLDCRGGGLRWRWLFTQDCFWFDANSLFSGTFN